MSCASFRSHRLAIASITQSDTIPQSFRRDDPASQASGTPQQSKTPWWKPVAIGSSIILALAVLALSISPSNSLNSMNSVALWVFALPLGAVIVFAILACILKLLALFFDKAADSFKDSYFELSFLAILLVSILFTYMFVMSKKYGVDQQGDQQNVLTRLIGNPFRAASSAANNVLAITIISDYLYICVEWLRKNHLTIFGFALLVVSFYLLYVLP